MKWFESQFYPAVKHLLDTGPVVMFFDGHFSHLSIALIKQARSLGIHLSCLPPNTTHILQPLDVGVFGPVKAAWRKILKEYKLRTRAANVTKDLFPSLIKELWQMSVKPDHLRAAFKSAGLFPFNPDAVSSERLSPAFITTSQVPPITGTELNGTGTLRIGLHETPIRVELRAFFVQALRPAEGEKRPRRRKRIELSDLGEVLTSDEVLERLEATEHEKEKKKAEKEAEKARKKAEKKSGKKKTKKGTSTADESPSVDVHCGKCGQVYTDAESEDWIGCDLCESWWHYWCAGLSHMLQEEEEWFCDRHE